MIFFIIMIIFSPITAIIPAVYAGKLLFTKSLGIEKNYWNIGLFLMFVYSIFSAVINRSILSLVASSGIFLYFALSILFQNYFIKINRVNIALKYLVYLTMLAAFSGIMEKIAFMIMGMSNHRIFSYFGNPNMAAGWFASIILVCLYLKSIKDNKKDTKIYSFAIVLIVIALLLTESSGGFIALIGSLFTYYLLRKDRNLKNTLTVIITVSIIAIIFLMVQNKVTETTPITELVTSFNSRYDIWIGSIEMFLRKPIIGWGLMGTMEHGVDFMYNNGNSIHSHNLWLTLLASIGLVGLGIYLYIKFNLIKDMIKIYIRGNEILPLLVSLNIMVIIQGMVDCSLYAPQLGILFIATGAITYNIANNKMIKKNKVYKVKRYGKKNDDIAV